VVSTHREATAPSANTFGAKLIRSRLAGNAAAVSASVHWPAVRKTRAEDQRPGQNSPTLPCQSNDEDRADVRVGRVDVPPRDGGSRRPQRHQPNRRRTPETSKHADARARHT